MESISIAAARPGHILAKAVTNATGAVLCPPGLRLTQATIERLRNAGVQSLIVEGGKDAGRALDERLADLQRRFAGIDDPLMLQIKAALEKRLNLLRLDQQRQP